MPKLSILAAAMVMLAMIFIGTASANVKQFSANLLGSNEVPAVATGATGKAVFTTNSAETEINYSVSVFNITDVTQAHIHCAPAGQNGGVVAFLYGVGPTVSPNGLLVQGTLTDASVIGGCAADLADLIAEIETGNTYVNVHTVSNPSGEIRGQILPAGVGGSTSFSGDSDSSSRSIALLAGGVAAVVAIAAGGLYTRRRWLRS